MDRISTEHDPVLRQIDPEMLNSFSSSSQTLDFSSHFSRTNASNKRCENRLSLSEILSNIRSCRLQCFQPRLLNLQDSDSEECTSRKPGQTVNNKRVSAAASVALLNTSKNGISGRQGFEFFRNLKYCIPVFLICDWAVNTFSSDVYLNQRHKLIILYFSEYTEFFPTSPLPLLLLQLQEGGDEVLDLNMHFSKSGFRSCLTVS